MDYMHLNQRFCLFVFYLFLFVEFGKPLTVSIEGGRTAHAKEVVEGTSPVLTCNYKLDNPSGIKRIIWKYNPSSQPKNISFLVYEKVLNDDKYTLTGYQAHLKIFNISRTQAGTYTCEVSAPNEVPSHGKGSYDLTVAVKPEKPVCQFSSHRVKVGETARFNCTSDDGIPQPKYAWYKDSVRLPQDRSADRRFAGMSYTYDETTGTLLFSKFSERDAGNYSCSAFNRAGEESCASFHVEAYSEANEPNTIQESTTTASTQTSITVQTRPTKNNEEALLVAYEKNQTNAVNTTDSSGTSNTATTIRPTTSTSQPPQENNVIHAVEGGRTLRVTIEGGRSNYAKEIVKGTSPVLRCHYTTSKPTAEKRITWKYNPIHQPKNITFIVWKKVLDRFTDQFALTEAGANLRILNVTRNHAGIYTCEVSSPHEVPSHGQGVYTISVTVMPAKPTCRFSSIRVKVGQSARFTCNSQGGVPTPKYAWYKDSKKLPVPSRFKTTSFTFNETTGTIFFKKFMHADEGTYTCSAFNSAGEKRCPSIFVDAYPAEVSSIPITATSQKTTKLTLQLHSADPTTAGPPGASTLPGGNKGKHNSFRGGATRLSLDASLMIVLLGFLIGKSLT